MEGPKVFFSCSFYSFTLKFLIDSLSKYFILFGVMFVLYIPPLNAWLFVFQQLTKANSQSKTRDGIMFKMY